MEIIKGKNKLKAGYWAGIFLNNFVISTDIYNTQTMASLHTPTAYNNYSILNIILYETWFYEANCRLASMPCAIAKKKRLYKDNWRNFHMGYT